MGDYKQVAIQYLKSHVFKIFYSKSTTHPAQRFREGLGHSALQAQRATDEHKLNGNVVE